MVTYVGYSAVHRSCERLPYEGKNAYWNFYSGAKEYASLHEMCGHALPFYSL